MFKQLSKRKAQSSVEYMSFVIVLMLVLMFFGKYIAQALTGHWRDAGETFGMGMQFEPGNTLECAFDTFSGSGLWYNKACFDVNCDCHSVGANATTCHDCIVACAQCNDF